MTRRIHRWFFFFLMVILGIGAGLLFGWEVCPLAPRNTQPDSLSTAYRTDTVLMIAELYHNDGDPTLARERLAFLGEQDPVTLMDATLSYAETHQYTPTDLQLMQALAEAIILAQAEGT
ncbi:MAG: hypothetical protein H0S79_05665 [Anaerolineaceae bacterium]|nr:hypothetical protein [Anaerolineaceae bacterium]